MTTDFARHLTGYLLHYLPGHLGASPNTVISYRDVFTLFLRYCQNEKKLRPEKITLSTLNRDLVFSFLQWLEKERGCGIATRNQRLAALHAFFRYLHMETPENSVLCQQILSIPFKRKEQPLVHYLSRDGIRILLAQPDVKTPSGRRDAALMSFLYDSGARVQELADVVVGDLRLFSPACVRLTGKGQKTRSVPLMSDTGALLERYLSERHLQNHPAHPLFFNRCAQKLSRAGVGFVLNKYAASARELHPGDIPTPITPHSLRHSKAMHLLQAGVSLIYIRDILGHVDLKSTEIYARTDSEMKRAAIEAAQPHVVPSDLPSWKDDDALMAWLRNLSAPRLVR